MVAYTDHSGNTVTKTGIEASPDAMLLHRIGVFEGDMLFEKGSVTS